MNAKQRRLLGRLADRRLKLKLALNCVEGLMERLEIEMIRLMADCLIKKIQARQAKQ